VYRRRCVGLLLLLRLPDGTRAALLRMRGRTDPQTGKKESYAGVSQVTIHGAAAEGENLEHALQREVAEELAEMLRLSGIAYAIGDLHAAVIAHLPRNLTILARKETPEMTIITMGGLIEDRITIAALQPLLRSGQLRLIREADLVHVAVIDPEKDRERIEDAPDGIVRMFPDEMDALKKAFSETFA